ncbi:MAG TPA: hypothetical protein VHK47_02200 [Polyangia bacterium]|jgi:hypothetical protein|nr:hypothetical protein [Polyangia bacterium]
MSAQVASDAAPHAVPLRLELPWTPSARPPAPLELDERFTVFIVPPHFVARVPVEDVWELYGSRRLWVVAATAVARAREVLPTVAVAHRPELVVADGGAGGSGDARQAVIATMRQLRPGDVLLVISDDEGSARGWVEQGMRSRASSREAEGESHSSTSR